MSKMTVAQDQESAHRRWQSVGCMAALLGLAVVAAIVASNVQSALQRGRQNRTMKDMQWIERSLDAYRIDVTSRGSDDASDAPNGPTLSADDATTDFRNDLIFSAGSFVQ